MVRVRFSVAPVIIACGSQAQWTVQQSHTTASLRGIHALGNGIAWASGTQGTVLRTTDDGTTWQTCTTPPEAEKLDFRGIQAFDANTAIVMSSGDHSHLYKTTEACKSLELDLVSMLAQFFGSKVKFKRTEAHALARSCRSIHWEWPLSVRLRGYLSGQKQSIVRLANR